MITSAYAKNSNSLGFNPIYQKICETLLKITFSNTVCRIFLIFCRLCFINNFIIKNNFSEPQNHSELNISRTIYFTKISAHCIEGLICANKLKYFFFKNFFFNDLQHFSRLQNTHLGVIFLAQKINSILFLKCDYWILTQY